MGLQALSAVIGGVVLPFILLRMRDARDDRRAAFARIDARLDAHDKYSRESFEGLKDQLNGVHLESTRDYATKGEMRIAIEDLRGDIALSRDVRQILAAVTSTR